MKKYTHVLKRIKKSLFFFILFIFFIIPLYTDSPPIKRLTGVNWFGFETGNYAPHGLWSRDYRSMLRQIKDLGFNCLRIPWSNEMLGKKPVNITINEWVNDPYSGRRGINEDLSGKSSLEVLDLIIYEAGKLDLRIILDCHSRSADAYMEETLWYTDQCPESKWISDWVFITERYLDDPNVVAFDLNNEPHGGLLEERMKPPASWGYDVPGYGYTDWKAAGERCAAAILKVNPNIIIIMQGVQEARDGSNYWWGSNHKDLLTYPVTSIPGTSLMFSVHEYGPSVESQLWFDDPTFPYNLEDIWRDRFWFIYEQDMAGLFIGEMGLKEEEALDTSGIAYQWFTRWLQFAGDTVHWTYWSWNPNSGDTGGLLKDDWVSINMTKYNLILPYIEPPGGYSPHPTKTPPHEPTPYPTSPTGNGIIINAEFIDSQEGFNYVDDPFKGTSRPEYASGAYDAQGGLNNGGLGVYLGGLNTSGATSGGWTVPFYTSGGDITITFDYRMILGPGYENYEYGEVIVSVDGNLHILNSISGDEDVKQSIDTGWLNESFTINVGSGNHSFIIGVYNNKATAINEYIDFVIDNVYVVEGILNPTASPPPSGLIGDVNNDEKIDILDSFAITQFYINIIPEDFNYALADVDCSDVVDIVDALIVAQYYVRLIDSFCL